MGLRRTDPPSARTDEERRRAREERERRRGRVVAPSPDSVPAPHDDPAEPAASTPAEPVAAPPAEPVLAPPAEPVFAPPPEPSPVLPADPVPTQEPEPVDEPPALPALPARTHRPHLHRPQVHRPHLHRPHLHRPHLHRPHVPRARSLRARLGALGALVAVVAVVGAGAFALVRSIRHKAAPIKPLATTHIVIPEGFTATQIAALARAHRLGGDYLKAVAGARQLNPARYGAPAHERSLEGFLFPATYELYAGASASKLVSKQLAAFDENFSSKDLARAQALGVTPYQMLIVASMVEREASMSRERPLVAAVIYNRLRRGMPLGIDATLRYALHNDYTHPLTEAQLHSSSPYNTRTHTGLPPTPISNPGVASIEAAANPARVSFLYYVARADGCPGQVFSSSYSQFEHDATAYRQALSANHGRVPACHKT
ncbi:MAG: endolytic transglycosylase MltG [Solirubrobacteraceae bacterium]